MTTPICDFIRRYIDSGAARMHMPGHKGVSLLGFESHDITEFTGADSLFEADGIIRESEDNASALFGCPTFYSTEGSSLAIRAMLYLMQISKSGKMKIAAGRNAHKVFLSAAALLDFDIDWLCPEEGSYLAYNITPEYVEEYLRDVSELPRAVYLTSPDYIGNELNIRKIAEVCHRYGVMLLVDNAHGAYLRFLEKSRFPMDLGADICVSSAHKTLPALTGAAYLHIAPEHKEFLTNAKDAMMMFATTSPSYVILESLDAVNSYLECYPEKLAAFISKADKFKDKLARRGFGMMTGDEPLKVSVMPKVYGYTGTELASILEANNVFPEFSDPDFLVMMLTPETSDEWMERVAKIFKNTPRRDPIYSLPPKITIPEKRMSVREAMMAPRVSINANDALGKILAVPTVGCPPAVPIVVSGEVIDEAAISVFRYYGIDKCTVVK